MKAHLMAFAVTVAAVVIAQVVVAPRVAKYLP